MNENRYAAPASVVADLEDPAPAGRPRNVVIGVYLLWIELVIGIPGMFYEMVFPSEDTGELGPVFLVVMAVIMAGTVALIALLNVKCWQGRHWARVFHLVLLCLGTVASIWALPVTFAESALQGVVYIVQTALNIAGVALLFTPPANAWYRALRAARR